MRLCHLADLETEVKNTAAGRECGEFMAICSNWAALASRVLTREECAPWLDKFIAVNGLPAPLIQPDSDHEFGLNFSGAWGLWDIYAASGRADVAAAHAAHLKAGYQPATNWRGSYQAVGQLGCAIRPVSSAAAVRAGGGALVGDPCWRSLEVVENMNENLVGP
jgi:hypothetical protein